MPQISVVDVDDFEDKPIDSIDSTQNAIKIKEEPKDDGYDEDENFEDIGTFEEATIIEDNSGKCCSIIIYQSLAIREHLQTEKSVDKFYPF